MSCLFVLLVLACVMIVPVARGVHRELVQKGFAFPTLAAVAAVIVLFALAGLILVSKFRFAR